MDPTGISPDVTIARTLSDQSETEMLAAKLAKLARRGDVIALAGDLGVGKTAFARAFIRARLRTDDDVPSPTFTLVQIYEPLSLQDPAIWHFDLFRLHLPEDALELAIEDAFAEAITLIEWPERLGGLLPDNRLDLTLMAGADERSRRVLIEAGGDWRERLREGGLA